MQQRRRLCHARLLVEVIAVINSFNSIFVNYMTPTQRLPLRHNEERAEVQCVSSPPCSLFARRDCNRHRRATEAMEAMGWLPKLQFLNDFDVLEIAYKALTAANKSPDIFDWMGHSSLFMWLFNAQVPCRRVLLRSFHCEVV